MSSMYLCEEINAGVEFPARPLPRLLLQLNFAPYIRRGILRNHPLAPPSEKGRCNLVLVPPVQMYQREVRNIRDGRGEEVLSLQVATHLLLLFDQRGL
jgi:hypothetical protein